MQRAGKLADARAAPTARPYAASGLDLSARPSKSAIRAAKHLLRCLRPVVDFESSGNIRAAVKKLARPLGKSFHGEATAPKPILASQKPFRSLWEAVAFLEPLGSLSLWSPPL